MLRPAMGTLIAAFQLLLAPKSGNVAHPRRRSDSDSFMMLFRLEKHQHQAFGMVGDLSSIDPYH